MSNYGLCRSTGKAPCSLCGFDVFGKKLRLVRELGALICRNEQACSERRLRRSKRPRVVPPPGQSGATNSDSSTLPSELLPEQAVSGGFADPPGLAKVPTELAVSGGSLPSKSPEQAGSLPSQLPEKAVSGGFADPPGLAKVPTERAVSGGSLPSQAGSLLSELPVQPEQASDVTPAHSWPGQWRTSVIDVEVSQNASVWRPDDNMSKSGLGHILVTTLENIHRAHNSGAAVYIDLCADRTQYGIRSREPKGNLWEDYFEQPFTLQSQGVKVNDSFCCKQHPGGAHHDEPINEDQITRLRFVAGRYIQFTEVFKRKVQIAANAYLKSDRLYLACHLRGTDKGCEASENMNVTSELAASQMFKFVQKLSEACPFQAITGILICADTQKAKRELKDALLLKSHANDAYRDIHIAMYPATLPEDGNVAPHMCRIDKATKSEDIMIEIALMSVFCIGLVATRSNVVPTVLALAPGSFFFTDIWQTQSVFLPAPDQLPSNAQGSGRAEVSTDTRIRVWWFDSKTFCVYNPSGKGMEHPAVNEGSSLSHLRCLPQNIRLADHDDQIWNSMQDVLTSVREKLGEDMHVMVAEYQGFRGVGVAGMKARRTRCANLALGIGWSTYMGLDCSRFSADVRQVVADAEHARRHREQAAEAQA